MHTLDRYHYRPLSGLGAVRRQTIAESLIGYIKSFLRRVRQYTGGTDCVSCVCFDNFQNDALIPSRGYSDGDIMKFCGWDCSGSDYDCSGLWDPSGVIRAVQPQLSGLGGKMLGLGQDRGARPGFALPGLTPAQELTVTTCATERHQTANTLIGIGMRVMPFYGAYRGFKHGSGILGTVLWTLGGYFLGGLLGGFAGVAGLAAVNQDCMREAGIFNGG